jgi:oxidase EvaA
MRSDNLLHATTRSVLSALLLPGVDQYADRGILPDDSSEGLTRLGESIQWLDNQKAVNHMLVKRKALNSLRNWGYSPDGAFIQNEGRFFRITGIDVTSYGREVAGWHQPILANSQAGIIGLLMKTDRGKRKFLLHAKAEAGNRGTVQMGPTVQFSPGNYLNNPRLMKPFLFDEFAFPGRFPVFSESMQSEEGARFLKEANCHRILLLPEGARLDHPEEYRWMTEDEVRFFLYLGENINSCARSIIACLL